MYVENGTLAIAAVVLIAAIVIVYAVLSAKINKLREALVEISKLTADEFKKVEKQIHENRNEGLRNTAETFNALADLAGDLERHKK